MEIFDHIHKTIKCSPLATQIIDTPQFQRLRRLKQLGAAHFVFPAATHTRFSHSLGVAALARSLMLHLQQMQPELEITSRTIELLFIAGLCHDLGHGPFSHAFDLLEQEQGRPTHEHRSCVLTKQVTDGILTVEEQQFVCHVIMGQGEGFLYEIIANKRNGLDVDKLDYIVRDSCAIGFQVPFDIGRILENTQVLDNHLTWNKKLYDDVFEVFRLRYLLHKKVYCHHAVLGIELLIMDILRDHNVSPEADDHVIYETGHPLLKRLARRGHYRALHYEISGTLGVRTTTTSRARDKPLAKHLQEAPPNMIVTRVLGFGQENHPLRNMSWYDGKTGDKVDVPLKVTCNISRCYEEYLTALYST